MWKVNNGRSADAIIVYICSALVIAAGVGACLLRGYFFTEEMYPFLALWFGLCCGVFLYLCISVGAWRNGVVLVRESEKGSEERVNRLGKTVSVKASEASDSDRTSASLVRVMLSVPLVVIFLYILHWLCGPLSSQGTVNEILRWGMYASFAFLICSFTVNRKGRRIIAVAWSFLGMLLSMGALLSVFGVVDLPFGVAYSNSPEVSVTGARLAGLMEYPNAFGAVMAVYLLERLFAVAAYYGEPGRWHTLSTAAALLRLLPLFPYAAALLLSESRGAWLTAACAAAAVLLWKRQLIAPLLAAGAAPVATAALLYRQLARAGLAVEPLPGLLLAAGLWAGALLAGLWLCRRWRSAAGMARAAVLALAALGWTAAGTAVLLHVRERITGPSSTVSARGLFYRDAWRLAVEAPWLGRGGETWRNTYLSAQSRPYVGSQVHNGYLDILLNLGCIGLAAILLMLLAAGWLLARRSPQLLPPFLVIVLHSAVDFDWSYGLFWLLLFWLPALSLSESTTSTNPHTTILAFSNSRNTHLLLANFPHKHLVSVKPQPAQSALKNSHPTPNSSTAQLLTLRFFTASAICICFWLSLLSFQAAQGESLYRAAIQQTDPAVRITLLQQSLAWNPRSYRSAVVLSRLLLPEASREVLQHSLKYSPENAALSWEIAKSWMTGEHPRAAAYWIQRSMKLDRYNNMKWMKAIEGMLVMGRHKLAEGDRTEAIYCVASGNNLVRQYRILSEYEASQRGRHNDRGFRMVEQADDLSRRLSVLASSF